MEEHRSAHRPFSYMLVYLADEVVVRTQLLCFYDLSNRNIVNMNPQMPLGIVQIILIIHVACIHNITATECANIHNINDWYAAYEIVIKFN